MNHRMEPALKNMLPSGKCEGVIYYCIEGMNQLGQNIAK